MKKVDSVKRSAKTLMPLGGSAQVVVARRATGPDLTPDHALDHERVAVAPAGQGLVDVHEATEQAQRATAGPARPGRG